jgi:osmotically-inducible protein OsmY
MANATDDLSEPIVSALQADRRLDLQRFPIRVSRHGDGARLEGEVESLCAKRVAVALARRAAGGRPVQDALRLAPQPPSDDRAIGKALVRLLLQQRELHNCTVRQRDGSGRAQLVQEARGDWPSGEIELGVRDGEITLEGKVISLSHQRMIEALAWHVPGCRNVLDRLQVVPAEDDNDDELTDAIRLVLEMDPFVHADQLGVRSESGVVTLEGVLKRDEEKQLAETDAWSVCGVVDVRNRIEVRPI